MFTFRIPKLNRLHLHDPVLQYLILTSEVYHDRPKSLPSRKWSSLPEA
jgi:hypothetical protein